MKCKKGRNYKKKDEKRSTAKSASIKKNSKEEKMQDQLVSEKKKVKKNLTKYIKNRTNFNQVKSFKNYKIQFQLVKGFKKKFEQF